VALAAPGRPLRSPLFDGSQRRDSTVLVAATLNGRVSVLGAWEKSQGARKWRVPREQVHPAVKAAMGGTRCSGSPVIRSGGEAELDEWRGLYGEYLWSSFRRTSRRRMAPALNRFRTGRARG
jgi:hypothetical protein